MPNDRFLRPFVALTVLSGVCVRPAQAAERPNVVLVMADDQGWGQTGYYKHPILKTPNLDAMAAGGLRLDRFYAAGPVCSPTRASVLTGRAMGVGRVAVALLSQLGYNVTAVTGKESAHEYLKQLGAQEIIGRTDVDDRGGKPMLPGRWAGGIDVVGGNILTTVLRATRERGCVAACGVTAGGEMPLTVYPFILRGVTLAGIDSSRCPLPLRHELWHRLANEWKPKTLDTMARPMTLEDLPNRIPEILAGNLAGRWVVEIGGDDVSETT